MEYFGFRILYSFNRIFHNSVKGLLFTGLSLVLFACSSLRNIDIEVSVMPEYPISEDVQSLVLVNRSMNLHFSNTPTDSLEKILINNQMQLDSVFRDSIAADTVIHVAANELFNSGRFDVVIPKTETIDRFDLDDIRMPLNVNSISKYCTDYNVDAVLVLESYAELLTTKYDYKPFEPNPFDTYKATTDIYYKSDWRLYRPDTGKAAIRFQVRDSIFWSANGSSLREVYSQMPKTKEALIGGGIAAGLKMAGYISPKWVSRTRYYFITNKSEIDAAVPLINENKWEEATAIWAKYANIDSKRIRGKVEFNLALAAEMSGNLDLAIEWGLKSYKTSYCFAIEEYLKTLERTRKAKLRETKQRY
jgi:hypothetical protein